MRWFLLLSTAPAWLSSADAQLADLAVINARIYTSSIVQSVTTAIAIKDGRIIALGPEVKAHIGPATRQIDAHGKAVIPGLIDSHVHMRALGESLEMLDLRGLSSESQAAEKVHEAVRQHKPGEWVRGRSWDQNLWAGKQFPSAPSLNAAAPDNPVYLTRVDGHAAWVNRKALDIADINARTADPPGGKILHSADGSPTGVLIDRAKTLVTAKMPPPTPADVERMIASAAQECARLGITTVHDAGVDSADIAAYRSLISKHRLPVRVYAMILGAGPLWNELRPRGPEIGEELTIRSIKLVADGALGSRGAALLQPYSDDPGNSGLLMLTEDTIRKVSEQAVASGFQVNTHAIGDRANRIVLNAYAAALAGPNDRRFRIEHAQIVAPDDFARFQKYSVLASMQATHATSDMGWAALRLGPDRLRGAYAWQTFLKLGVRVPNGSDFPVENPNPLWGFYSAATRQDHSGNPPGGWFPDQRMTRQEALRSWTLDGAFAAFEEKQKGSLEVGKMADFLLLSADIMQIPPAEILKTQVLITVRGGEIVFRQ